MREWPSTTEDQPATVPAGLDKPERVAPAGRGSNRRFGRTRMLTALEQGVKGGKWFSLIDKVYPGGTLRAACRQGGGERGSGGSGSRQTVAAVRQAHLDANLGSLSEALRTDSYRPQAVRRRVDSQAGQQARQRPLGIPTVRDRVVQTALRERAGTDLRAGLCRSTATAFGPDGAARTRCGGWIELLKAGYVYVVDADLKSYFDTIPHDRLMAAGRREGRRRPVLGLIEAFLQARRDGRTWRSGRPKKARRKARCSVRCWQHLSRPAGPSAGPSRDTRWCVTPTTS